MTANTSSMVRIEPVGVTTPPPPPPPPSGTSDPTVYALSSEVAELTTMMSEMRSRQETPGDARFLVVRLQRRPLSCSLHRSRRAPFRYSHGRPRRREHPNAGPICPRSHLNSLPIRVPSYSDPCATNFDAAIWISGCTGFDTRNDHNFTANTTTIAVRPAGAAISGSSAYLSPSVAESLVLLGPTETDYYVR